MKAIPDSTGRRTFCPYHDNGILWEGLSQPLAGAIEALPAEGSLERKPVVASELAMIHGLTREGLLDCPVAKGLRKQASPHRLPVI